MRPAFLFLIFQSLAFAGYAQAPDPLIIKSGDKKVDVRKLKQLVIIENIQNNGIDSIHIEIEAKSIRIRKNILLAKVKTIEETRYLDQAESKQKHHYDTNATEIKIPLRNIDMIKGKRQPLAFVMGSFATVSYLGAFGAAVVGVRDPHYNRPAEQVLLAALPVLALSGSIYFGVARKRYHFDPSRTHKRIWQFQ